MIFDPYTGTEEATDCKHEVANVEKLIDQLSEIIEHWEILAEGLVPRSVIDGIKMKEQSIELMRRAALRSWYDSQERPCWEPIVNVLREMRKNNLAGRIQGCLSEGCDCHLVKCTETRPTGKEADHSETTHGGHSTTTGTTLGST